MKILILNYEFPPVGGGASPVSLELAKGLVRLGHSVTVVTMRFGNLPKEEVSDGIKIYRVWSFRNKKEISQPFEQLTYIFGALLFLFRHLRKNHYDVNHTHFLIPTGIISIIIKKLFGLPYIITSHGSDVPNYNPDRFVLIHKFTGPLLKRIARNAEVTTTPSKYLNQFIQENIPGTKVEVIPNGSYDYLDKSIKKEKIILTVGRLHKMKGFHLLISAFKKLKETNWKLYIVGDGPYKEDLLKLANGDSRIIFTGWLDNMGKEYSSLINRAEVFSLLSERETQGIVFVEALSAGCAIFASDIPAVRETLSESDAEFVDIKNQDEIYSKLEAFLKKNKETMMSNSRKLYESKYRYENISKKYEGLMLKASKAISN